MMSLQHLTDRANWVTIKEGCYIDKANRLFIKNYPKNAFNWGGYNFQSRLPIDLCDGFSIAKFAAEPIVTQNEIITLAPIYESDGFSLTADSCRVLGKALSTLHIIGSDLEYAEGVTSKSSQYSDMSGWDKVVHDAESQHWRNEREQIIRSLPPITPANRKAILHRDFKKHNFLLCAGKIVLIDFDFTAIDYLAIEIGNFLADLLARGQQEEIKAFLDAYLANAPQLAIDVKSCLTIFLRYLCTNTFPWYCRESFSTARFNEVKAVRDESFNVLKELFHAGHLEAFRTLA